MRRTFDQALREARLLLAESIPDEEHRGSAGTLLGHMDALLAECSPAAPPADPRASEMESLRREVERLRVLAAKEQGLLSTILNESPHGILVCDPQGKLIVQNRAAERIWAGSATANDVEGWGRYQAFHPDGRPYAPSDWSMARCLSQNQTVQAEEIHFQRFDGTHGILLGSCAPIRAVNGTLLGAVSVFTDITRFKQAERLKDRWVALAGHEIRSPLQVLKARINLASTLLAEGRDVDVPRLLKIFERQVNRMQTLVEDLLDVSRAQNGTLRVRAETEPLTPIIVGAAELVVPSSPKHSLAVAVEDVIAVLDPARTEQVITNLLNNALQYSPDGGRIEVRVKRLSAEALVEVADQGLGFEPDQAQKLFQPFFQLPEVESYSAVRHKGLGLGLYLCRELVERMHGRIQARSEGPGKGATFSFTLPLAAS